MAELFDHIDELRRSARKVAVATLVNTRGTTPRKEGAKMLVGEGGAVLGSVTIGGCVDAQVIEQSEDVRSEEHTSELQSPCNLVCRLLLEKKKRPFLRRSTFSGKHRARTMACVSFISRPSKPPMRISGETWTPPSKASSNGRNRWKPASSRFMSPCAAATHRPATAPASCASRRTS